MAKAGSGLKKLILRTQEYGIRSRVRKGERRFDDPAGEMWLQALWCCGEESTSGCGEVGTAAKNLMNRGENEA